MSRGQIWDTPGIIDRLRDLWKLDGLEGRDFVSTRKMAIQLGTTKNSIISKAHRLNLPGRASPILKAGEGPGARKNRILRVGNRATLPALTSIAGPTNLPAVISKKTPCIVVPAATPTPPPVVQPVRRFMAASSNTPCCWMVDPRPCAEMAIHGRPYCEAHCERAYVSHRKIKSSLAELFA